MARVSAAIAGLTAVLVLCKLSGAPFGWAWVLAPLAIALVPALAAAALIVLGLIAAHRSEKRDGLLADENDRFAGSTARGWRLSDSVVRQSRQRPTSQRAAF